MSYDPYDSASEAPRPGEPYDYSDGSLPGDVAGIKGRVQGPAIALIVVAIINLLVSLVQVGGTILAAFQSPQEIEKNQQIMAKFFPPEVREEMEKEKQNKKQSPEAEKIQSIVINTILSLVMVIGGVLSLLGGIRMLSLRSYALCVAGSISAAIPCISCGGSCGFGEAIGIWALVVLLNADVRSAFH